MKKRKDIVLDMYFIQQIRPVDISKKLDISKSAVTQILKKDKRYSLEKTERKNKNENKHSENTKKYIKNQRKIRQFRNSADDLILKEAHNKASAELSKHKRLSDIAYRDWNKSAFSYNEKKRRFEFREELGRSYDVPKYIKVEVL